MRVRRQAAQRLEKQLLPESKTLPAVAVVKRGGDAILPRQFALRDQQSVPDGIVASANITGSADLGQRRTTIHTAKG